MSQSVLHTPPDTHSEIMSHQQFPFEKKEIHNKRHYAISASFTESLTVMFATVPDVCIGGDQAFYWNREDDRDFVCPDAYLIRGADNSDRASFKLWEEVAKYPKFRIAFVLEVWSHANPIWERYEKFETYRDLGVAEYLEFDPETNALNLFRLDERKRYKHVAPSETGELRSVELGAEIKCEDGLLRLYRNGEKVLTAKEANAELARLKVKLTSLKSLSP